MASSPGVPGFESGAARRFVNFDFARTGSQTGRGLFPLEDHRIGGAGAYGKGPAGKNDAMAGGAARVGGDGEITAVPRPVGSLRINAGDRHYFTAELVEASVSIGSAGF